MQAAIPCPDFPERMAAFSDWLQTPLGQYLLRREHAFYDQAVADLFGYYAVQVELPQIDLLRQNRISWRSHVGLSAGVSICCDPVALPLASNSVDLLLLPHVLDFHSHPHQVLREAERVLVPDGKLLLTGFNPYSLWGLTRRRYRRQGMPWCGNFLSLPRLKDWLELLSLEVDSSCMKAYAPPFAHPTWLCRCQMMEDAGGRWWPIAGGLYCLEAVKRVRGMRLILPDWRSALINAKPVVVRQMEPAHRAQHPDDDSAP